MLNIGEGLVVRQRVGRIRNEQEGRVGHCTNERNQGENAKKKIQVQGFGWTRVLRSGEETP